MKMRTLILTPILATACVAPAAPVGTAPTYPVTTTLSSGIEQTVLDPRMTRWVDRENGVACYMVAARRAHHFACAPVTR